MFDAHNHFTCIDSIKCSSELLPQFISDRFDINKVTTSEIGMDKRFYSLVDENKQITYFKEFLDYSKQNNIPVTLHNVHCTDKMIKIIKSVKPEENTVIWHGFNGSSETAKELNKLGILVSIGPGYNKDIVKLNSICTFLLETDYDGNSLEEHDQIIYKHYKNISDILNVPMNIIEERCINEAKAFAHRVAFR